MQSKSKCRQGLFEYEGKVLRVRNTKIEGKINSQIKKPHWWIKIGIKPHTGSDHLRMRTINVGRRGNVSFDWPWLYRHTIGIICIQAMSLAKRHYGLSDNQERNTVKCGPRVGLAMWYNVVSKESLCQNSDSVRIAWLNPSNVTAATNQYGMTHFFPHPHRSATIHQAFLRQWSQTA